MSADIDNSICINLSMVPGATQVKEHREIGVTTWDSKRWGELSTMLTEQATFRENEELAEGIVNTRCRSGMETEPERISIGEQAKRIT
jgi:hypothetical protein